MRSSVVVRRLCALFAFLSLFVFAILELRAQVVVIPVSNYPVSIVTTAGATQVVVQQQPDVNGGPPITFFVYDSLLGKTFQIPPGGVYTFQNAQGWPAGTTLGTVRAAAAGGWYFKITQTGQLPTPTPQPLIGIPFMGMPIGSCTFPQQALDETTGLPYGCNQLTKTWNTNIAQTAIVTLTSAQILNLSTTPVVLLPALGLGYTYQVESVVAQYRYGTSPYSATLNSVLNFAYPAMSGGDYYTEIPVSQSGYGLLDGSVNNISSNAMEQQPGYGIVHQTAVDNQPFEVWIAAAAGDAPDGMENPTGGDGTIEVILRYEIISLS